MKADTGSLGAATAATAPTGRTDAPGVFERWTLAGGHAVRLRPLSAADAGAEQAFFNGLSLDSRHQRFHFGLRELSPGLLKLLTEVDQQLHRAWVLEAEHPGAPVIADARYVHDPERKGAAEFAVAVADGWQGRGLGRRLVAHLIREARTHGLERLFGDVLAENRRMLALLRDFGFRLHSHPEGPQLVRATLALD